MAPATHRSLSYDKDGKTAVIEKPLPTLDDDSVLIKVHAVTLNPTDWKHIEGGAFKQGYSTGSDFAGDVIEIGKTAQSTSSIKVGDTVAGCTRGGVHRTDNGAFQEYVVMPADLVWRVDKSVLGYDDAASMGGIALSTAVYALNHNLGVPYPAEGATIESAKNPAGKPILIWSGATAVGVYAIKIAALAGYRVATTSSPHNFNFVRSLGAEVVFDYRDPETPAKIKEWANGQLQLALDPISFVSSTSATVAALKDAPGSKVVTLTPIGDAVFKEGGNVEEIYLLIYDALLHKNESKRREIVEWYKRFSDNTHLQSQLKVLPIKRLEGGLERIHEGIQALKDGKTSAEKLAYFI